MRWPTYARTGGAMVVVAACDQPDLDGATVAALVGALADAPAELLAAAVTTPDGRRQPFPSAWRPAAGPLLVAQVEGGARRADAGFAAVGVVDLAVRGPVVADLDTPDDVIGWLDRHRR